MSKLRCCGSAFLILASCLAFGQDPGSGYYTFLPNQQIRVPELPSLKARSDDLSDVLLASLDTVFHDPSICCGKNSALEDAAASVEPLSLKEVGSKLQGRHLLSDGRPILVTADFMPASSADASYRIISALMENHALLLVWKSHLYVLDGADFDETLYSDGTRMNVIHKLRLLDTRFSDARREVVFNRDSDDWGKVQGTLLLTFAPQ